MSEPAAAPDSGDRRGTGARTAEVSLPLPAEAAGPPPTELAERLAAEMARRWRDGERPSAEEFLGRHPELARHSEAAVDLIYQEVCLRQEHGQSVDPAAVLARFPQWRRQLGVLLDCHRLLDRRPEPRFPEAGEALGEFRLLAELGRGALGRVFLARQSSLADRSVVLKLTPRTGAEHLSLARLQHTHVVPLFSAHDDPARNLRVLCMPYFGGAILARVLEELGDKPPKDRTGGDLLRALDRAQAGTPVALPTRGPGRDLLARATYVEAVCAIGLCLAEALQYAHERGLLHLDLKPANVLLAADAAPMLLDFHLAREPVRPGQEAPAWLGGTLAYMPREQQAALAAVSAGRPVPAAVDGRADVYALGAVLYEALGGPHPYLPGVSPRLERCNPAVSGGLADLVHKCLAFEARDRYPDAAALAADLRAHLGHRTPRGAPVRRVRERWANWRRRQPHVLPLAGMAVAVVLALAAWGLTGLAEVGRRTADCRQALAEGEDLLRQERYPEAEQVLRRGLALAGPRPGAADLRRALAAPLARAEEGRARAERERLGRQLHRLADRLRWLASADGARAPVLRQLQAPCRDLWEHRAEIVERLGRDQARDDLLDVALCWCDQHVAGAGADAVPAARREAVAVLAQAEEQFGPGPVLARERQRYGDPAPPSAAPPQTAWEHTALGRSYLRTADWERASASFEEAVRREPAGLWPNLYLGLCRHHAGRYPEAVAVFSVCVGAAPDAAGCYYNRALALAASGRTGDALRDYDRALALDPGLAPAALNRGLLHYREGRHTDAVADLERALEGGADPARVHYNLALVRLARGDRDAARRHARLALDRDPANAEVRALAERLRR
jgi:serine/threonine protein kinase/tetratricopeptide (TPR) repeat protein